MFGSKWLGNVLKGLFGDTTKVDAKKTPKTPQILKIQAQDMVDVLLPILKTTLVADRTHNSIKDGIERMESWINMAVTNGDALRQNKQRKQDYITPDELNKFIGAFNVIHEALPEVITSPNQTFDVDYTTLENILLGRDTIDKAVRNMRLNSPDENLYFDDDQHIDTAFLPFEPNENFGTMAEKLATVSANLTTLLMKHNIKDPTPPTYPDPNSPYEDFINNPPQGRKF